MQQLFKVLLFILFSFSLSAQTIDKVEAVIGDEIVLTSDIESQYVQYIAQGYTEADDIKCTIIEDILFQKLLVHQAKMDSISVEENEVDAEIEKRLQYFENQLGSVAKVEAYFDKELSVIQQDLKKVIRDQLLGQRMRAQITKGIKVTPAEVKTFFATIPAEEIPSVAAQVKVAQLVIKPIIPEVENDRIRTKLNNLRKRVYDGEDFKVLAALYSDDPGSANNGGELGFVNRGDLVPEFERAAFRLKQDAISEVIQSEFGFHIVQLIERRGEQINVRHILIKPKVSSTALRDAKLKIDSIAAELNTATITFDEAIKKYSDDESKNNGGLIMNPSTGTTTFFVDDLGPSLKYIITPLEVGGISQPLLADMPDKTKAYRICMLKERIEAHATNLVEDYAKIQEFAVNIKTQETINKWVDKQVAQTYIRLNTGLSDCEMYTKWNK